MSHGTTVDESTQSNPLGGLVSSIQGQFDSSSGGGFADQAQDFLISTGDASTDDFVVTGFPKKVHDTLVDGTLWGTRQPGEYQARGGDQVDVPGAGLVNFARDPSAATAKTLGDTVTFAMGDWDWSGDSNQNSVQKGRVVLWAVLAGVVLWLVGPLLEFGAAVAGGDA